MANPSEPRNPFYFSLLAVGLIFIVTVLAYAVIPVLEEKAMNAGTRPPTSEVREWLAKALKNPLTIVERVIPDEQRLIEATLKALVDDEECALVLTTSSRSGKTPIGVCGGLWIRQGWRPGQCR